jgi:hypothetical protein
MRAPNRHTSLRSALLLAAIGAAVTLGATAAAAEPSEDELPSRLLVTAREYNLALSRPKLDAGPAIVELYDYGEDPHDLMIQRLGGTRVYALGEVAPGETGRLDLRLRRGSRYRLWCSLEGHAALGMDATLRTSKRKGSLEGSGASRRKPVAAGPRARRAFRPAPGR